MAIKVGGTTVIDDSRALSNIASVDAATVTALSAAGVGAGGGKFTATADGTIGAGDAVALQTNGTVKGIEEVVTALSNIQSSDDAQLVAFSVSQGVQNLHYYPSLDVFIYFAEASGNILAWVFSYDFSTNSITMHIQTRVVGSDSDNTALRSAVDITNGQIMVAWRTNGLYARYAYGQLTSTTQLSIGGPSAGSDLDSMSGNDHPLDIEVSETDNCFRLLYGKSAAQKIVTFSASGTNLYQKGSIQNLTSKNGQGCSLAWDSDNNRFMATLRSDTDNDKGLAIYFSTSATTGGLTLHDSQFFEPTDFININFTLVVYNPQYNKFLVTCSRGSGGQMLRALSVSGSSFTVSNATSYFANNYNGNVDLVYDPLTHKIILSYVTSNIAYARAVDISSSTPSTSAEIQLGTSRSNQIIAIAYSSIAKKFLNVTRNASSGYLNITEIESATASSNSTDWIGFASEAISDAATGDILVLGSTSENQSGLTAGSSYYVQSNGTVSTQAVGGIKAGRALSATKLLITEGNA